MGKLYNRADEQAQIAYIDACEQRAAQVPGFAALSRLPYGRVQTLRRLKQIENGGLPLEIEEYVALEFLAIQVARDARDFETERKKCKMRLLRTGQLIADLTAAQASGDEKRIKKMVRSVSWASKENAARRLTLETMGFQPGRIGDASEEDSRELNEWEQLYYADRQEGGRWPFPGCMQDYGPGYIGWLRWRRSNEAIPAEAYMAEISRLRREGANV